ncbi:Pentatricopeptide repeat-containing protein [Vigna angularis]|uniref:Pentatricopeptide repeat-containing protein n=1 Tax=Phaseolus angularis TaxID=3914 RepID=A0A8T0L6L8_PHAAN|nr:Pentatricopeptide repeat-containing protein [Vigna angularis]
MKRALRPNLINSLSTSFSSSLPQQHKLPSLHFHTNIKAHFVAKLQTCKDLASATSTHSNIVKFGFSNDTFAANHLINCYLRLFRIDNAQKLFDEMPQRNVVSWTSLMAGYVGLDQANMALCLFRQMQGTVVLPNEFTFATLINACSILVNLEIGRRLHALVETQSFHAQQCNQHLCESGKPE